MPTGLEKNLETGMLTELHPTRWSQSGLRTSTLTKYKPSPNAKYSYLLFIEISICVRNYAKLFTHNISFNSSLLPYGRALLSSFHRWRNARLLRIKRLALNHPMGMQWQWCSKPKLPNLQTRHSPPTLLYYHFTEEGAHTLVIWHWREPWLEPWTAWQKTWDPVQFYLVPSTFSPNARNGRVVLLQDDR